MTDQHDPEFVLTLFVDGTVQVWSRVSMPIEEFAKELRRLADGFESGEARRIE